MSRPKLFIGLAVAALVSVPIVAHATTPDEREVTWIIPNSTGAITFPQYLPGHIDLTTLDSWVCQHDWYDTSTEYKEAKYQEIVADGVLSPGPEDSPIYKDHEIWQPGEGDCPAVPTPEPEPTVTPTPEPTPTEEPPLPPGPPIVPEPPAEPPVAEPPAAPPVETPLPPSTTRHTVYEPTDEVIRAGELG